MHYFIIQLLDKLHLFGADENNDIYLFIFQHQQQVLQAIERAKQVTMNELNAIIGVCIKCDSVVPVSYRMFIFTEPDTIRFEKSACG